MDLNLEKFCLRSEIIHCVGFFGPGGGKHSYSTMGQKVFLGELKAGLQNMVMSWQSLFMFIIKITR